MSGAFDIRQFLDGWSDTDAYLLNPASFLPDLGDAYYLNQYRRNKFVLATGEWDICRTATEDFSRVLAGKGLPHSLHVWGFGAHARLAVLAADGQRLSSLTRQPAAPRGSWLGLRADATAAAGALRAGAAWCSTGVRVGARARLH